MQTDSLPKVEYARTHSMSGVKHCLRARKGERIYLCFRAALLNRSELRSAYKSYLMIYKKILTRLRDKRNRSCTSLRKTTRPAFAP